eukprot:8470533-Lingulodinium_polyedra.AAC.1
MPERGGPRHKQTQFLLGCCFPGVHLQSSSAVMEHELQDSIRDMRAEGCHEDKRSVVRFVQLEVSLQVPVSFLALQAGVHQTV